MKIKYCQAFYSINLRTLDELELVKLQASSVKRQASDRLNACRTLTNGNRTEEEAGVRQAECLANAGPRTMRAAAELQLARREGTSITPPAVPDSIS